MQFSSGERHLKDNESVGSAHACAYQHGGQPAEQRLQERRQQRRRQRCRASASLCSQWYEMRWIYKTSTGNLMGFDSALAQCCENWAVRQKSARECGDAGSFHTSEHDFIIEVVSERMVA